MTESVIARMQAEAESRPKIWRKIAGYITEHADEVTSMRMRELSERVGVSEGSIVNFCRSLGYDGFVDMKVELAQAQGYGMGAESYLQLSGSQSVLGELVAGVKASLDETVMRLCPDKIEALAKMVIEARRVLVFGLSTSAALAEIFSAYLMRLGIAAMVVSDAKKCRTAAKMLGEGDLAIAVTYSGRTPEIAEAFALMHGGAKTACVTCFPQSAVARLCELVLELSAADATEGAFPLVSRITQLTVLDAVCASVQMLKA